MADFEPNMDNFTRSFDPEIYNEIEDCEVTFCLNNNRHSMRCSGGAEDSGLSEDHLSMSEEPEEEPYAMGQPPSEFHKLMRKILRYLRQVLLLLSWLTLIYFLMFSTDKEYESRLISVRPKEALIFEITKEFDGKNLWLQLKAAFNQSSFKIGDYEQFQGPLLAIILKDGEARNLTSTHYFVVAERSKFDAAPLVELASLLEIRNFEGKPGKYQLHFFTNFNWPIGLEMIVVAESIGKSIYLIWSCLLIVLIYATVMFDLVHHSFAGLICCSLAIGLMAVVNLKLSLQQLFQYIEMEVIMSFFGISIIMEILAETGLQDHLAARSYELAKGHIWPMLNFIFLASFGLSTIFDDITLILFLAPICLRLCEIMHLNCTPVLSCLIIAINVGSTMTPASSVTNNLIAHHKDMPKDQLNFGNFTLHMLPIVLLTLAQSYIQLRLQFINSAKIGTAEPLQLERLKRLTRVWRKVSERMGAYSLDERVAKDTVDTRIRSLRKRLKRLGRMPEPPHGFEERVRKLHSKFPLKKLSVLFGCLASLFVILLFSLLEMLTNWISISLGWLAVLAALLCLSLCSYKEIESILSRIDWATMLLLSCYFILLKVFIKLGLMQSLGLWLEEFITNRAEQQHLTMAILAILWLSALLSFFINNAAVVILFLPHIVRLSLNSSLKLSIMPMIWSLALGCCLGGNGSIMASVVNIACAGVASKHGYMISYFGYMKIGFFVMLGNILIASCYLLMSHVVGNWH